MLHEAHLLTLQSPVVPNRASYLCRFWGLHCRVKSRSGRIIQLRRQSSLSFAHTVQVKLRQPVFFFLACCLSNVKSVSKNVCPLVRFSGASTPLGEIFQRGQTRQVATVHVEKAAAEVEAASSGVQPGAVHADFTARTSSQR